ncbi:MAG: hypothetical protein LBQ24_04265 [Candidatus Peribacteria bacterium]|nr:hypothetical protein [Candidatus Peribacteria bacterium]
MSYSPLIKGVRGIFNYIFSNPIFITTINSYAQLIILKKIDLQIKKSYEFVGLFFT